MCRNALGSIKCCKICLNSSFYYNSLNIHHFLRLSLGAESPGGLVKTQISVSDSENSPLRWGPRVCISNELPGDADASGWENTPWEPLDYGLYPDVYFLSLQIWVMLRSHLKEEESRILSFVKHWVSLRYESILQLWICEGRIMFYIYITTEMKT